MTGTGTIRYNGKALFGQGQQHLDVMSYRREQVDRGFAGLNGVLSMDLGHRGRIFRQRGELSESSATKLYRTIEQITAYIDGQCYDLIDPYGVTYRQIRMDCFELTEPVSIGSQVRCKYQIQYTQLGD